MPKDKLAIGVGIFDCNLCSGSVVGLAVGGSIINNFGWHATFFSILPVAIMLWVVIYRFIRDNKAESETSTSLGQPPSMSLPGGSLKRVSSIDLKGAVTLAVTIASFLLALTYIGNSNNLNSSSTQITVVSLALLSIGSLALFVIIEKQHPR